MKDLASQEDARAEKLSAAARQVFAFVAGFFGVVQIAARSGGTLSHAQVQVLTILAIAAAVLVALTAALSVKADALRTFRNLNADNVIDSINDSIEIERPAAEDFTRLFGTVVDELQKVVGARRQWLTRAQIAAGVCIAVLSVEMIVTLTDRL
jgi:cytochrome c biogenesis protein CcdA